MTTATAGTYMYSTPNVLDNYTTQPTNIKGLDNLISYSSIESIFPQTLILDNVDIPEDIQKLILQISGKGEEDPDRRHFPINLSACDWQTLMGCRKALGE